MKNKIKYHNRYNCPYFCINNSKKLSNDKLIIYNNEDKLYNVVNNYFNNLINNIIYDNVSVNNDYISRFSSINTINNSGIKYLPIRNHNFKYGSYRIKESGYYKLMEDIIFHPNEENNFFPTKEQFDNGDYPKKPFHLGFFAAIVIESDDVIIDLNGFSIKQSDKFKLIQRFFNLIEVAPSPFIPNQGPGSFSSSKPYTTGIMIYNGKLINSSHNAIHGNSGRMIYLKDLSIEDFEVSGIQLNGYSEVVIENCHISNTSTDIPINSLFSNALFGRLISKDIPECSNEYNEINNDIEAIFNSIDNNLLIPDRCKYLTNDLKISDCNVTGIVLNTVGVAINDFKKNRKDIDELNNYDVLLRDITIKNIISSPVEIIGLSKNKNYNSNAESYSNKVQVGMTGDVIPIVNLLDKDNKCNHTSLSKLQFALAEYDKTMGTCTISDELIQFSNDEINIEDLIIMNEGEDINANLKYHCRGNLDIMSHTMKGNMGIFISAGQNIYLQNVTVNGVYNNGDPNNSKLYNIIYEDEYRGNQSIGVMVTGSTNIRGSNVNIKNIQSKTGKNYKIKLFGENKNINII